ncbi:MAG: simple sugar transport system permease protein [Ilumatobacter sp.]
MTVTPETPAGSIDNGESDVDADERSETAANGVARRAMGVDLVSLVAIPIVGLIAALLVGGVFIALIGENPITVYGDVIDGVLFAPRGLSDTATAATPLLLIALGYAFAYRARVFTIGAEGQYVVAAAAAVGVVTAAGVRDVPGPLLIVIGLAAAACVGALWSGVCGVLFNRFGASIVISSLMLVYIGQAMLQWATRVGIRDPDSFVPLSRSVGAAALPTVPGIDVHLGFVLAVAVVPVMTWVLARHRLGFRVTALGHNPEALDANDAPARTIIVAVLVVAGALAGLAGFIEIAGVNGRLNDAASVGYGFGAIIVALVGRLHPVGVLAAALVLGGLDIGFEVAARSSDLPTSMAGLVQVLVVVFVVAGDALLERRRSTN